MRSFSVHDCKQHIGQISYKLSFYKGKSLVNYKQVFDLNMKTFVAWRADRSGYISFNHFSSKFKFQQQIGQGITKWD